ncbi:23S rRNA (guanosine(2251)-2'-O)-methyltransferase RlmB [Geminicoccaceae bacterium 1502E]|nr:23S rRNA (guanosine(2251)-2'-O)-methyltransferase RlmB [Geminicoccaceae bacterium 1502E]
MSRRNSSPRPAAAAPPQDLRLYGHHAVAAALANPDRPCRRLLATSNALERLGPLARREGLEVQAAQPRELDRLVAQDAVHQGVVLETEALPPRRLEQVLESLPAQALLLAVDQVEDPRNLGALLRSAAAFGVAAVLLPERRSAVMGAVCAKAASGALDIVPIVEVTNLARTLEGLKKEGFWSLGLDAAAATTLDAAPRHDRAVLVLGAEGKGLRRLVAESCDLSVSLPISPRMESLNVAVAAGIALYVLAPAGSRA